MFKEISNKNYVKKADINVDPVFKTKDPLHATI